MEMTPEKLKTLTTNQLELRLAELHYEMEHQPDDRHLKGMLVTAKGAVVANLTGDLEDFYRVLECDCFDIATRKIGGKYFDIYVDDEGLLKDNPRPSAITPDKEVMLVGNLFICSSNEEGETISISDDDCGLIFENVVLTFNIEGDAIPMVLAEY